MTQKLSWIKHDLSAYTWLSVDGTYWGDYCYSRLPDGWLAFATSDVWSPKLESEDEARAWVAAQFMLRDE